ncbi:DegT/DnrJ/EryC1/StrS aminotransferase [Candidatus Terasakiella magnetica]|uniref:DegT/DnrJ/EryC1/StrS aminotransferase n=1 Tax=Candidatus Terasakiella magnetica TaxID=1867952 RepID=A0A1C3RG21_9PROT|nr:DegT/DnrJ/EryC1/StrS family aminotransferase [Candidatus Terasakiella magnetica]SCA56247.1 DegT/DnrJ/EryC1/StrS aminotransferase [Candidatus Terasakiella magnetica]
MGTEYSIQISLPSVGDEEWHALRDPLENGWLTQGPKVAEFERVFAEKHQVEYSLATTSCTTALHLALVALGIGPGDEVIIPAFTWVATANVVAYCGATPIFADVNPETYNIDVQDALRRVSSKTKVVIPVHLFGLCADVDLLREGLPGHVFILEDAACAAGAKYGNKFAGSLGDAAAFSFHPRKIITTGEGGMLLTHKGSIAEQANILRNHGASISEEQRHNGPHPYLMPDFNLLGFNYRMTDLQGAVGLVQLEKLERFIQERSQWAKWYREALKHIPWLKCPEEPKNGRHAWQAFVMFVHPDLAPMPRNDIMDILQSKGISTRPGTHAVHMLKYYKEKYDFDAVDYPNAYDCDRNTMAIPLHNCMTDRDYQYIVETLESLS